MFARTVHAASLAIALAVAGFGPAGCASEPAPDYEFFDACDPQQVPDKACYAAKRAPGSAEVTLATQIALRYIAEHPPASMEWNWEEGVLMYAMTELYRVTDDARVRDYYKAWMDRHIAEGYDIVWSDSCPPALTALSLYADTGEEPYGDVPREVMRYLAEDALRTDEGGISHLGTLNVRTLWVDSLFMFGMVLNRWGELQRDDGPLDEMAAQLAIFSDLLQAEGGLFVHAYAWPSGVDTDIYWGRGNGWVTVAAADYLRTRALRHQSDERVQRLLSAQISGIIATQTGAGAWWSIMNRPGETYLETSATALFAYGMSRAYRYGFAGDEVRASVDSAMDAVRSNIVLDDQDRPYVTNISGPTGAGEMAQYQRVRLEDDLSYGVGAVILALVETSGLP